MKLFSSFVCSSFSYLFFYGIFCRFPWNFLLSYFSSALFLWDHIDFIALAWGVFALFNKALVCSFSLEPSSSNFFLWIFLLPFFVWSLPFLQFSRYAIWNLFTSSFFTFFSLQFYFAHLQNFFCLLFLCNPRFMSYEICCTCIWSHGTFYLPYFCKVLGFALPFNLFFVFFFSMESSFAFLCYTHRILIHFQAKLKMANLSSIDWICTG